jgi:hypothetical protein
MSEKPGGFYISEKQIAYVFALFIETPWFSAAGLNYRSI